MSTAFQPMTAPQRARFNTAYLDYLRARDGEPDLATQRFTIREKFFATIDATPTTWAGAPPVDQRLFDANHANRKPAPGLDQATLWALATAKTNRSERFGVEYSVLHDGKKPDAANNPHTYIQIEEFYHTRILKDALATLGVKMEVGQPSLPVRGLVRAMVRLPKAVSNVLVLCGEITGVAIFSMLLERARVLFKDQPDALARIETLFAQIMVDEVGHVHFVRSALGPIRLALAKVLMPLVVLGVLYDTPELAELFGTRELIRRARAADVDLAAAPYPDRFVVPAPA